MWGLLGAMTSEQLAWWEAYFRVEPFGEERADLRMAILAALIANANRDPKKRRKPYTPADFMPQFGDETEPQDVAEKAKAIFAIFGGARREDQKEA